MYFNRSFTSRKPIPHPQRFCSNSWESSTSASERRYDPDSGQVYSEVEVRFGRKQYSDWIGEPRTPSLAKKPPPMTENGARSLAELARNKIVTQFRDLTAEHFATVPWPMAEKVWDELTKRRGESFHAWRTLARAYPHPEEFGQPRYRYLLEIRQPQLRLTDYFTGITSPELSWLTCLRISPKQLATPDLVSIHQITNLAVLDLSDGQVTIDDGFSKFDQRIMRTWAELAASGQAFQHLRVLMLGWQEHVSDWIFEYLNHFPSMCHLIVTDCPKIHQKNRYEWEETSHALGWEARHAKKSAKSLRPIIGDQDFAFASVSGAFYTSREVHERRVDKNRRGVGEGLPLLEAWIGSPRSWSHIVEDFPSTRTVFFDNNKTQAWVDAARQSETQTRDQHKRVRNFDSASQGNASPPPKRGTSSRPMRRKPDKSMAEMLREFQN